MRCILTSLAMTVAAASTAAFSQESGAIRFVDVTASSGIDFVHNTGAFGQKWLPETMGSGVVLFDYNGDGKLDVLFLNGTKFPGKPGRSSTQQLYENLGGMKFRNVTKAAGLAIEAYCMGGAAGDLDNDGDQDLYISCVGNDILLQNEGGEFTDVSAAAGLSREYEFGASVALLDADNDGLLDIFATRYVTWTPETDLICRLDGKNKSYCTPEPYEGASPRFYHNTGDFTFVDWTRQAGLFEPDAKSLGVAVMDLDDDFWLDLAVANDTQPNLLFHNNGDGTFEEIGLIAGMAFDENGVARGGMGIDAADYDGSGRQSLVIGNFDGEMVALYHNVGDMLFIDSAAPAKIGRPTLPNLSFATFFFDYDLDGDLDLLVANGHLEPEIETIKANVTYAQPTQLFRNDGGRFTEVTDSSGGDLATPRVARGAAYADLDQDGDLDVVISTNGGPAQVFENTGDHGNWLQVDVEGAGGNRDGLGAVVEVVAGGVNQRWLLRAGGSYLSQSQTAPIFGLAGAAKLDSAAVVTRTGTKPLANPGVNQRVRASATEIRLQRARTPPR
ncbi:MAG: CRTAC1 family protein [Acidobacteria bacterium]|nr:CRTAC1 family protein [Acidobacteriota bacterium]